MSFIYNLVIVKYFELSWTILFYTNIFVYFWN